VRVLGTEGLSALLERAVGKVAQLEPTEAERDAFLRTDMPDVLLRELPIHALSDGTVGSAEGTYREGDWAVPTSLREHVLIVQPSRNAAAITRQQRIVAAWSPTSQLESALSRPEPHRLRIEILDALAKLSTESSELETQLLEKLQTTQWLVADGTPIAPSDVLTLPASVDEAARALLLKEDRSPAFLPAQKLAIEIREHDGFAYLADAILRGRRSSFEALALMIADTGVIGRLGSANDFPTADFAVLAADGVDLRLPGWPLLAAVLTSQKDERDWVLNVVEAFSEADDANAELAAAQAGCGLFESGDSQQV
jgi:hypothetical protein